MFYEILDAFIDLSAVTEVEERLKTNMTGGFEVEVRFCDAEPFVKKLNAFAPGDAERSRLAVAQLGQALRSRAPQAPRLSWPYDHNGMAFDLRDVRMIGQLERRIETTYPTRSNRRPSSDVRFAYSVIVAGQPRIDRVLANTPDIKVTPLHHEHERLLKMWLRSLEREAA